MKNDTLKNDLLLLLTAIIWGFSFTAQRAGMEYIGPFTFNGVRFLIGSISLLPLIYLDKRSAGVKKKEEQQNSSISPNHKLLVLYGAVGGGASSNLQRWKALL